MSALAKLSSYMTLTQRRFLTKSFIEAHFDYCPLVWMFHSRVLNRKISHLCKCSLRIVYKESISSIHELLQKDHSFTIHHKNIESLAIELYKIKENLSNEIASSIFPPTLIKYNLRSQSDFFRNFVNSSKYVLNSIRFSLQRFGKWFQWKWKIWRVLKILKTKLEDGN